MDAWRVWEPSREEPWDLRRVVHLHRRAGFAASWRELQRDLKDGPQAAVDRLLQGAAYETGVPEEFELTARILAQAALSSGSAERLKAWWIYRMLCTPDPLRERMALLWHNHFATSQAKVNDLELMRQQNEVFRRLAYAPFGDLLTAVIKHPALLIWLDADANRREHPNENLARELMELFTLGVGQYTDGDVQEAARTLTGWTVRNRSFAHVGVYHDAGMKNILGQRGAFQGDDLLRILLEHPATSSRLAVRLCGNFMGEGAVSEAALAALAAGLQERQLDIRWGVETVLRSAAFFAEENIGNRVLAPVELIVGAIRALELFDPPPSTLVLAGWTARLGQDLFHPPNVFGWSGGRSWITTRSMIGRTNFAAALCGGMLRSPAAPPDLMSFAGRHANGRSSQEFFSFLMQLLFGTTEREGLASLGELVRGMPPELTDETACRVTSLLLGSPAAQLA